MFLIHYKANQIAIAYTEKLKKDNGNYTYVATQVTLLFLQGNERHSIELFLWIKKRGGKSNQSNANVWLVLFCVQNLGPL